MHLLHVYSLNKFNTSFLSYLGCLLFSYGEITHGLIKTLNFFFVKNRIKRLIIVTVLYWAVGPIPTVGQGTAQYELYQRSRKDIICFVQKKDIICHTTLGDLQAILANSGDLLAQFYGQGTVWQLGATNP